jgi:hypothetical protein
MNLTPVVLKSLARIEASGPLTDLVLRNLSAKVTTFEKHTVTCREDKDGSGAALLTKQLAALKKTVVSPTFQESLKRNGTLITEIKFRLMGAKVIWTICYPPRTLHKEEEKRFAKIA